MEHPGPLKTSQPQSVMVLHKKENNQHLKHRPKRKLALSFDEIFRELLFINKFLNQKYLDVCV